MSEEKKSNIYNPNITKSDKDLIGDKKDNLRNDGGDDEALKNRERPVDFAGKDLDVPGRELPSERTKKQLKDEENQLYSQGGPGNDHLEQTESSKNPNK